MANTDARFGLKPVRSASGGSYVPTIEHMYIPAGYATALFKGDPVVKTGTSNTAAVSFVGGNAQPGMMAEINRATAGAGNMIDGVIVGFAPLTRDSGANSPASTEGVALVEVSPDVVFEIQEDGDAATIAATDIGLNADLVFTHAGMPVPAFPARN